MTGQRTGTRRAGGREGGRERHRTERLTPELSASIVLSSLTTCASLSPTSNRVRAAPRAVRRTEPLFALSTALKKLRMEVPAHTEPLSLCIVCVAA